MRLAFRTVPVRTHLRQPRVDWCSQSLRPSTPALPTPSFPPLVVSEEHSSVLSEPSLGWALSTLLVFISLLALSRNLGASCCPGADFLLSGERFSVCARDPAASRVACQRSRQLCGRNYPENSSSVWVTPPIGRLSLCQVPCFSLGTPVPCPALCPKG